MPSDFEAKTGQILHEGNAKPLVRDVPEVVDGIADSAGEVLSAKRPAIGPCHEVHQSEQRRSKTRRINRQLPETRSQCRDVLKDILKLIRLCYHGKILVGPLA